MTADIAISPLLPWPALAALGVVGLALLVLSAARRGRGTVLRALGLGVLVVALLDPRASTETREPQPDVAVVLIDDSPSQAIGEREAQTEFALDAVQAALGRFDDLQIRLVRILGDGTPDRADSGEGGTRLVGALARAFADVPESRIAGAIVITDGQVHDAADAAATAALPQPMHVLLTGRRDEMDRRLVVEEAPGFGIVGQSVAVRYRVVDRPGPMRGRAGAYAAGVSFSLDGADARSVEVPVGEARTFEFTLDHAGPTVVEIAAEPAPGELSSLNNRAVVRINGVRDRLRVLLVSGQPHAGERTWRNLLKSDPSVDLVHFTILRPPEKDDMTPLRELALIVFPIHELFEVKLGEFDLILFDRYIVRDVLPPSYLRNIVGYVRDGGALMLAIGPEFAGLRSLFRTPLGELMPGAPTGEVLEQGFRPSLTDTGRRHPVTAPLVLDPTSEDRQWGRWFRQIEVTQRSGHALMSGIGDRPLFVLDRVEKGRVGMLMSDHIWLWAREFEGGGPQAELLRRLAHWLMKEPELEEERLSARVQRGRLTIERHSLESSAPAVTVTTPSGATREVVLEEAERGVARASVEADEPGIFRVDDGSKTTLAVSGGLRSLELADLRATDEHLAPLVAATGGGLSWIGTDVVPEFRRTRPGRDTAGRGWMGLRENGAYVVTGFVQVSLLPGLLILGLVIAAMTAAWWREGR